jgi:hypothetical protein
MPEGYRGGRDNPSIDPERPATRPAGEPPAPPVPRPGLMFRALSALADWIVPLENPAGTIYGLIVIGALLAGESGRHESYLGTFASAAIAAAVYWLAHAYSGVLGRRLVSAERLTARALGDALIRDLALIRGAAIPLLALVVAALAGASQETAVSVAIWSAVASLVGFELLAGIRAKAAPGELVIELGVGVSMGVAILALKIVLH